MKWLAIMNRHSGCHSPERFRQLSDTIHRQLGADIAWTWRGNHALKLVRKHKSYDGFIAVGGDGTISDIVNGLSREEQCLGIIPFGTGNALAHDLGLTDEAVALRALCHPRFDRLDVIRVRYLARQKLHQCTLIANSGIGYLAGATAIAELPFKRWGSWWYVVAAILQSFRQGVFVVRLRVDDGPWRELAVTTLMVHNSQYVGQFRLVPEASLTDGRLNLLYGRLRPARQLFEDLGVLTETYSFPNSTRLAPRKVELVLTVPQTLMLDGYLVSGVERIHYQVVQGGLRCCTG
jgi:diacylglycerol kinase (ATP)